mmetsp:Transcript_38409/g.108542  ORF Transcript_38409/g.108542 Transcript_38409/m.108542 type:complete len:714 (-) Transcript_38409:1619-3760(-)
MPLLSTPQGLRAWLPLKSPRGEPVGAVEVAVHFLEIGGQPNIACHSPLERLPELAKLLPESIHSHSYTPVGFDGQQARVTVHIEEALLPRSENSSIGGRNRNTPKFFATYRLPGSSNMETTPSVAASPRDTASRGQKVQFGFSGIHWVKAGGELVHALRGDRLQVKVYCEDSSQANSRSTPAPVLIGTAQVDMIQLTVESRKQPGRRPGARLVMGTYHLIDPAARDLGAARVRLKVLLEMSPAGDENAPGVRQRWDIQCSGLNLDISVPNRRPMTTKQRVNLHDGGENPSAGGADSPEGSQPLQGSPLPATHHHQLAAAAAPRPSTPPPGPVLSSSPLQDQTRPASAPATSQTAVGDVPGSMAYPPAGISSVVTPQSFGMGHPAPRPLTSSERNLPSATEDGPASAWAHPEDTTSTDAARDCVDLRFCIESALHLRLRGEGSSPMTAFCTFEWPVSQEVVHTPLVPVSSSTGAAEWFHTSHLPLWRRKPAATRDDGCVVLLKVHLSPAAAGRDLYHTPTRASRSDLLLGTAALDFSLLWLGLDQVSGWYNLLDLRHQPVGQIKVSLTPSEKIRLERPDLSFEPLQGDVPRQSGGPYLPGEARESDGSGSLQSVGYHEHEAEGKVAGGGNALHSIAGLELQGARLKAALRASTQRLNGSLQDAVEANFTGDGLAKSYMPTTSPAASYEDLSADLRSRLQELDELARGFARRLSS